MKLEIYQVNCAGTQFTDKIMKLGNNGYFSTNAEVNLTIDKNLNYSTTNELYINLTIDMNLNYSEINLTIVFVQDKSLYIDQLSIRSYLQQSMLF